MKDKLVTDQGVTCIGYEWADIEAAYAYFQDRVNSGSGFGITSDDIMSYKGNIDVLMVVYDVYKYFYPISIEQTIDGHSGSGKMGGEMGEGAKR